MDWRPHELMVLLVIFFAALWLLIAFNAALNHGEDEPRAVDAILNEFGDGTVSIDFNGDDNDEQR